MTIKKTAAEKIVELIASAADSKQAMELVVLDVRKASALVDFLVICSGETEPQIRAIEREIDARLRQHKIKDYNWEGVIGSGWVLLDLGSVVIHVLGPKERKYYRLEELWCKDAIVYHY